MSRNFFHSARRAAAALAATTLAITLAACGNDGGGDNGGGGEAGAYPGADIEIMVPAAPGGGWDTTARRMQQVIEEADLTTHSVEVMNVEGSGGANGLAQLINQNEGDPNTLMVAGLVMIGALAQADSPLSLADVTTIATLTSEAEAFVVRADSEFQTIDDVIAAYEADPASVVFGGGSAGGSDHIVAGLLLQAAGQDPTGLNYIGYSGGGEATAGILSGDVGVGVSGVSEFVGQIEAGEMRLLAISQDIELDVNGETAPTLVGLGYDVDFTNWRGIFAPAGLEDSEVEAITAFITSIHDSEQWAGVLEQQGWADDFRTGDEAKAFVEESITQIETTLESLGL